MPEFIYYSVITCSIKYNRLCGDSPLLTHSYLFRRCIWEIKVNRDRDFWLHFDRIKFSSKSCDDGIVDIFLKGKLDPYLSFCGENVSLAKDLPILSSGDLSLDGRDPSITIQFIGECIRQNCIKSICNFLLIIYFESRSIYVILLYKYSCQKLLLPRKNVQSITLNVWSKRKVLWYH